MFLSEPSYNLIHLTKVEGGGLTPAGFNLINFLHPAA